MTVSDLLHKENKKTLSYVNHLEINSYMCVLLVEGKGRKDFGKEKEAG